MNYAETIMQLDNYKESHPNLTSFWNFYINLRKKALDRSILECRECLDAVTSQDVNPTNLVFIYLYLNSIST